MHACSALGCRNRSEKGYLMKRFPDDPYRRDLWQSEMDKNRPGWRASSFNFLCEVHFEAQYWIITPGGKKSLKLKAVPTIFSKNAARPNIPQTRPAIDTNSDKTLMKIQDGNIIALLKMKDDRILELEESLRNASEEILVKVREIEDLKRKLKESSKFLLKNQDKKPGQSTTTAKPSQPTFAPEVVIKEEPIDIDEPPVPSTSITDPESILPCAESFQSGIPVLPCKDPVPSTSGTDHQFITPCTDSFQFGTTSTLGEAFTVIKTEPIDEVEPQTNSNDNTWKASKRKADQMADVEQSESSLNEDSVTINDIAKDYVFQSTIGEAYPLVKSGPIVELQQPEQKPQWYKTPNGTGTKSSQKKTLVVEQSLPVEAVLLTTVNESAKSHLDDYGKYIAAELKMLDSKSCTRVQRAIAGLLFDAKLGKFK